MEIKIKRMQVLHVWFHGNANKLIIMWVFLKKSLSDVSPNTLDVGIAQCSF